MRIIIVAGGRDVSVEIRDARSVPDLLKLCKALGLEPSRWYTTDAEYAGKTATTEGGRRANV